MDAVPSVKVIIRPTALGVNVLPAIADAKRFKHANSKDTSRVKQARKVTGPSLGENESTNFPGSTFEISRFSILEIFFLLNMFKNMLVRYRGINNKGVPERPGTKWRVLRAISITLKCQFTEKC